MIVDTNQSNILKYVHVPKTKKNALCTVTANSAVFRHTYVGVFILKSAVLTLITGKSDPINCMYSKPHLPKPSPLSNTSCHPEDAPKSFNLLHF